VSRTLIHTEVADIRLLACGVLEYRYFDGAVIDLARATSAVAEAGTLVDQPTPTLVVLSKVRRVTREAREFFAHHPVNQRVTSRVALVVATPLSRMIGNFFMGLTRPAFPARLCDDEESALAWLTGDAPAPPAANQ